MNLVIMLFVIYEQYLATTMKAYTISNIEVENFHIETAVQLSIVGYVILIYYIHCMLQ